MRCGDPSGHTAMAELVGVPCALATEHVLRGTVQGAGVIRPVEKCLYEPLLADLATLVRVRIESTEAVSMCLALYAVLDRGSVCFWS